MGISMVIWLFMIANLFQISSQSQHQIHQVYDPQNYQDLLQEKQQRFQKDLQIIKGQIISIKQTLLNSNGSNDEAVKIIEEGLADERDTLYTIQTYLNLPYAQRECDSITISQGDRFKIMQKVENINQSLLALQRQVDQCNQICTRSEQIVFQIAKQRNYLKSIQEIINSCSKKQILYNQQQAIGLVNLADSIYKDNLKASNWVLGSMSQQQFKKRIFQQTIQYNQTSCPITHPYVRIDGNGCMKCNGIFNINTRQCSHCDPGFYFDYSLLKCTPNCPQNQYLDQNSIKCTDKCLSSQNKYYNFETKSCTWKNIECSTNQIFNMTSGICQQITCKDTQIFDRQSGECINQLKITFGLCPPTKPRWNPRLLICEACPFQQPQYISEYNKCQQCPEQKQWNQFLNQCVQKCQIGYLLSQDGSSCSEMCPKIQGLQYNEKKDQCQSLCQQNQYFDKIQHSCQDICSESYFYSFSAMKCIKDCNLLGKIFNEQKQICQCPEGKLQDSQNECININCSKAQYYNSQIGMCLSKCPEGYNFNLINNLCYKCPSQYQFNKQTLKCTKIQCIHPSFFNKNTQRCEYCQDQFVYNYQTKSCERCQNGTFYDFTKKICEFKKCPSGYLYNSQLDLCQKCQPGYILNNQNNQCQIISCQEGYQYNLESLKCQIIICPDGQYYDQQNKYCKRIPVCSGNGIFNIQIKMCFYAPVTCSLAQYYDFNSSNCQQIPYCPNQQYYNLVKKQCQIYPCSPTQYFNQSSQTCNFCPKDYYYNINAGLCILTPKCSSDQYFSVEFQLCIDIPYCKQNMYFSRLQLKCSQIKSCQENTYFDQIMQQCLTIPSCTSNKYFNMISQECLQIPYCPQNYYFSSNGQLCIKNPQCPQGYFYKPETGLCHGNPSCPKGYQYEQSSNTCHRIHCPDKYHFDKTKQLCIKQQECTQSQYFDKIANICKIIPQCKRNEYFSKTRNQCTLKVNCEEDRYFNILAQQCIVKDQCEIDKYFSIKTQRCQTIPQCQFFFDKQIQKCGKCSINQYFDRKLKICHKIPQCQKNSIFNIDKSQCQKEGYLTDPNASNIIIGTSFINYKNDFQNKINSGNFIVCEQKYPYFNFNINKCVNCPSQTPYFNINVGLCQSCGQSQYDKATHRCIFDYNKIDISPTLQRLLMNIV